jgi:hypothetical protein
MEESVGGPEEGVQGVSAARKLRALPQYSIGPPIPRSVFCALCFVLCALCNRGFEPPVRRSKLTGSDSSACWPTGA